MIIQLLERGTLSISQDVFAIISSIVIDEFEEIVSTVSGLKDDFVRVMNKKGNQRGIFVNDDENEVIIDIKIAVYFGVNICELCIALQKRIMEEIKAITGIEVTAVNVTVSSVQFKGEK